MRAVLPMSYLLWNKERGIIILHCILSHGIYYLMLGETPGLPLSIITLMLLGVSTTW